jgi:hypothetical protein
MLSKLLQNPHEVEISLQLILRFLVLSHVDFRASLTKALVVEHLRDRRVVYLLLSVEIIADLPVEPIQCLL